MDLISPPVTLYYKGEQSHPSIYAGILTIIVYSISLAICISYAIDFFLHKNPSVCYYNRYIEDAGEFPINSSSMFSFIQILDTVSNLPDAIDFDSIRVIGIEQTIDTYEKNINLTQYDHWLYGPCDNKTDTKDINYLINFKNFDKSACIKKYYIKNNQKYYEKSDNEFIYPNILHGCSHPNRTFYGIIVEQCRNDTVRFLSDNKICKSIEYIKNYLQTRSIALQLIDQYADVLNYKKPYTKYFYSITNGLFEGSYTTNHLNLNPSTLITHNGILFDHTVETKSYFFDQNEKVTTTMEKEDKGIYVSFYFWMQNRMQYYERTYQRIQDVLSDIGGMCSILLTIANILNIVLNNYFILKDTEQIFNILEKSKQFDKEILLKNLENFFNSNIFDKVSSPVKKRNLYDNDTTYQSHYYINDQNINNDIENQQENTPNQQNINENQESINEQKNDENKEEKELEKINSIKLNDTNTKKNSNKQVVFSNISRKVTKKKLQKSSKNCRINIPDFKESSYGDILFKDKNIALRSSFKGNREKYMKIEFNNDNNNTKIKIKEEERKEMEKENKLRFRDFVSFFICCKTKTKSNYFEEFRSKILSEENIILSYFNISKLLKAQTLKPEIRKITRINSSRLRINKKV